LRAHRITAERAAAAERPGAGRGVGSPLVGRDGEKQTFAAALDRTLQGEGGILTVVGDAGLGKSRLTAEVRRLAPPGLNWLEGRTVSFGRQLSYWPFLELVQGAAGIDADDSEQERSAKLAALVAKAPRWPVLTPPLPPAAMPALPEPPNIGFMGTHVVSGTATAVAVATGVATRFGAIAAKTVGRRELTGFELGVKDLQIVQLVTEEYPIGPKEHGVEFLMDNRHLWLRSSRQWAVMRIRSTIVKAIRDWLDDNGFLRHIDAEVIDRQVLHALQDQILANKDAVEQGLMKMMGSEDIFTKAAIDKSIQNMDQVLQQGIPDDARQMVGMMGFRVAVNYHGEVLRIDQPGVADDSDE
jgi:hypothetical protein